MDFQPSPEPDAGIEFFVISEKGNIPNSHLPVILYRNTFPQDSPDLADLIEGRFRENGWTNAWRDGVYSFHHYHSTTHEVLGVFRGSATLNLGGEGGRFVEVVSGDVVVIPAGVAHKCLSCSGDFMVVGAYPGGKEPDLLRDDPGDREQADRNLPLVPLPPTDPVHGDGGPLNHRWLHAGGQEG